jgi:hypothetical protein
MRILNNARFTTGLTGPPLVGQEADERAGKDQRHDGRALGAERLHAAPVEQEREHDRERDQ